MKYRIMEGQNTSTGDPMYYVYKSVDGGDTWVLMDGSSYLETARKMVERLRNPVPQKVIEEFEG